MAAGDRLGRRTGATWETCRRTVGGGGFGCRNSGRRGGRHEVRPRRQEHSIRRERAGIGCGQSSEAKLEMLVYNITAAGRRQLRTEKAEWDRLTSIMQL